MDSFLSLFDPGVSDEPVTSAPLSRNREENGNVLTVNTSSNKIISSLPPEPQIGNIEYKLKLINPSKQRFEHLVTQMKWRLREGQGEAIYEIGVEDSGRLKGLSAEEMSASLATLNQMAVKLGATTTVLRETVVNDSSFSETVPKIVTEVLVRKIPDDQPTIDLRVAVMGNADAGKSTLLGVLTQGEFDDGRGKARLNMFNHLHEIQSGRTSSICHEFLGFDSQGRVINYQDGSPKTICELSTKLVTLIDLAGHQKYLRTTIRGVTGYSPHYVLFIISSGVGFTKNAQEHLSLALALQIPVVIVVTKVDLTTAVKLEKTLKDIEKYFQNVQQKKIPVRVANEDDVINVLGCDQNIPILGVSSVTGAGLPLLYRLLFLLPPGINPKQRQLLEELPPEFQIDETFRIPRQGKMHTILGGLLTQGVIAEGTPFLIGPFINGSFRPVQVTSIRRHKTPCRTVRASQSASLGLNIEMNDVRPGMVLISPRISQYPKACVCFQAAVYVLYHATSIAKKFQTTVYVGNVRQTAIVEDISTASVATDERALVTFRFIKHPEHIQVGSRMLFREGDTKGFGTVTHVYPMEAVC
ncbi:unnamed protein product [Allacma fusca]|uniref:Tr-type G domain-containing protein n=1 Tax=Allacma fusca TaxID=39272 RepID=A0A8J2KU39_9HEXA|nr:unnamed protein product [Allacma fusca]